MMGKEKRVVSQRRSKSTKGGRKMAVQNKRLMLYHIRGDGLFPKLAPPRSLALALNSKVNLCVYHRI